MPNPRLPANERRDQKVSALLTSSEKASVATVAKQLGMSMSNAARYLIMRGLATHGSTSTFTAEGEQHDD